MGAAAAGRAPWDLDGSTRLGYSEAGYDPAFMLPFCVHVRGPGLSCCVTCLEMEMCAEPHLVFKQAVQRSHRSDGGPVHRADFDGACWSVSECCMVTAGSARCRWPPGQCANFQLKGTRQALRTGAAGCHQLARCGLLALALRALAAADAPLRALAYEAVALAIAALATEDCRLPSPRRCGMAARAPLVSAAVTRHMQHGLLSGQSRFTAG